MIEAPFLTLAEVRQEVERIFQRDHRSKLVALFGRGDPSALDISGSPWRVVPTRCELDLREHLPRPDEARPAGCVYLVDWTTETLPLDVACRLAGGRLYHVARDARLAALFGARQVDPGLAGSALAKLFLGGKVSPKQKVQGLRLTYDMAWQTLLQEKFRLSQESLRSVGLLLAWAVEDGGGPAFARLADSDDLWRNVRRELHEWLRTTVGEPGLVVWQAWEQGLAPRLLEALPLLAAARRAGDPFLAGQLTGQLSAWLPGLAAAVRSAEQTLTDDTVIDAALPAKSSDLLAMVGRTQTLADNAGLGGLTFHSHRLPGGHTALERALATSARSFLTRPDAALAAGVVEALTTLEGHKLDGYLRPDPAHREARRSIARLVLWLSGRSTETPHGARWQPVVDLAGRYSEEGGHVEWARQQIHGLRGADEALLGAARELEGLVLAALRDDHRVFAGAYVSWVEAGKPSAEALPIEDLGKHVISPFLKGDAHRKLLVVLMDGMSQAVSAQILTRLSTARRWGPIAWRKEGWNGVMPLPPVLAAAPTLTDISRGAFFAGKADPRFGEEATDRDPSRWRAHRALAEFFDANSPDLFLRRDILSGHDLSDDIRDAIKGESRVIAVVVNAIDEDLKSSVQVAKDYSLPPVLPLDALMSAAEEGERAILLVADHGHILGDGTRTLPGRLGGGRPGGPRWRALAEGELPMDEEVVLPESGWVPRNWHRVAALWDPTVVNRSACYGEHGGLSLAETVAPAVLIAPDWLERAFPDDPWLAVRPFPTPSWWDLRIQKAPAPARLVSENTPRLPAQSSVQPMLLALPTEAAVQPLIESLRRSSLFQNQLKGQPAAEVERVLSWLSVLAEAGDSMSAADFAAAAGVRAHQIGGVVARMGLLNADGFAMVEYDHVGRRVLIHRSRLTQHYGVKE